MINVLRDFVIGVGVLIIALLITALGQGAFDHAAPSLSSRSIGTTDISTYASNAMLACLYFCAGLVVPRWLRSSAPLLWLVLPIVAVYLLGSFGQPGLYRCKAEVVISCWVVLSPFLVSLVAVVLGFLYRSRWRPRSGGPGH
jgi:hypothetical protein